MDCRHRGPLNTPADTHDGKTHPDVYYCMAGKRLCTIEPNNLPFIGGTVQQCGNACDRFIELQMPVVPVVVAAAPIDPSTHRPSTNVCYFTGSNRSTEPAIIKTMIASARAAGVTDDFHVFATSEVSDAINHGAAFQFDRYMFKVDLLRRLQDLDYEYFVWIDPDNYFVRNPGSIAEIVGDELIWVSMEGELTAEKAKTVWWEIGRHGDSLIDVMRSFGCVGEKVWNTNAGLFIVRKSAIAEFCDKMFDVRNKLLKRGYAGTTEEPPLAIVGQTMVKDPGRNGMSGHAQFWVSDWIKASTAGGKLPDGKPFAFRDWVTDTLTGDVNPAIVHVMGNKLLMAIKEKATDYLTCHYRGKPIGEQLNCQCGVDREIYRCLRRGLALKRLPPGKTKDAYGAQMEAVSVCSECDLWKLAV